MGVNQECEHTDLGNAVGAAAHDDAEVCAGLRRLRYAKGGWSVPWQGYAKAGFCGLLLSPACLWGA